MCLKSETETALRETGLSGENVSAVLSKLDPSLSYNVYRTGEAGVFAGWAKTLDYESKKAGYGSRRVKITGEPIVNINIEFARETHYDYSDPGVSLLNEEKRIANFNMGGTYVSLFVKHETSDVSGDVYDRITRNLYIYIPDEGRHAL